MHFMQSSFQSSGVMDIRQGEFNAVSKPDILALSRTISRTFSSFQQGSRSRTSSIPGCRRHKILRSEWLFAINIGIVVRLTSLIFCVKK
jgi:hypothetical protein